MSSAGLPEDATASGGPLWLFADPYAYQYAEIPQHVRQHESRSPSPARTITPTPASATRERTQERIPPPARRETTAAAAAAPSSSEHDHPPPMPAPAAPPRRYTAMPAPPRLDTKQPDAPKPAPAPAGPAPMTPRCLQPGGQWRPLPHVLNYVNHGEIVRSRHASPQLSGTPRFPGNAAAARKMTVGHTVPPLAGARYDYVIKRADTVPLPLVPGLTPVTPVAPALPSGFPPVPRQPSPAPAPAPAPAPKPRPVIPMKPGVSYEPGWMVVEEEIRAAAPKKDFDAILSEIRPQTKTSKWRRMSRAIIS